MKRRRVKMTTKFTPKLLFITTLIVVIGSAAAIAIAQTYFQDDFEDPNVSQKKWVDIYGTWEFKDGEYQQLLGEPNCMSVVADDYWDESWNEYTYELRGNKISGAEGFLIMFRCRGQLQARGKALRDHPARMATQTPALEYWWNLGGWGNSRSQVESWGGKAGANSNHTVDTDKWHEIKIVNTPTNYTLFMDGEKVATVEDAIQNGVGRVGLATWSTLARFDDVLVYGSGGPDVGVSPMGKATSAWGAIKFKLAP